MKNLLTPKDHNRRYYLHSKVKAEYQTNSHKREVIVPANQIETAKRDKRLMELCSRFGYNIQTAIV